MDDFEPLKLIGKGAFGEVRICRDRSTGKLVAVKKLRKAEMVRRGQVSAPTALLAGCSTGSASVYEGLGLEDGLSWGDAWLAWHSAATLGQQYGHCRHR